MSPVTVIFLALLIALQVADLWTTHRVLSQGGYERNPLLAELFGLFGHQPVLLAGKAALAGWLIHFAATYATLDLWLITLTTDQFLAACIVLYGYVVWHNWGQIKR